MKILNRRLKLAQEFILHGETILLSISIYIPDNHLKLMGLLSGTLVNNHDYSSISKFS